MWDADKTLQQHAQHVEYTLQRETEDTTRVRFEITLEPSAPIPEFLVNRARKKVLYAATEGLRRRVMAAIGSDRLDPPVMPAGGSPRRACPRACRR